MAAERIHLSPPDVGPEEQEMVAQAIASGWIAPLGPEVQAFEVEFARAVGVPHAAALSSGTAALHLALRLLDIGPGDRVAISDLTFVATANAVRYLGAEPVLIDADESSWCMDPDVLADYLEGAAGLGQLPKAVIVVDLYGQCADYERLVPLCERYGVPIIEDAAEALGARYGERSAGAFGLYSAFSFNGNKMITTSGGGMLVGGSKESIDRARFLASQAREPVPYYEHKELGYNYRLSNILAALGRAQLRKLADFVDVCRGHRHYYDEALQGTGLTFMPEIEGGRSSFWLTCAQLDPSAGISAPALCEELNRQGIEMRQVWKPMHLQPLYEKENLIGSGVSRRLFERGVCFPSGSSLTDEQRQRVVSAVRAALANAR